MGDRELMGCCEKRNLAHFLIRSARIVSRAPNHKRRDATRKANHVGPMNFQTSQKTMGSDRFAPATAGTLQLTRPTFSAAISPLITR